MWSSCHTLSYIFFIVKYCLSIKEINTEYNHLYFNYILSIQLLKLNGTDFAEAKEQDQASFFDWYYFRIFEVIGRQVAEGINRHKDAKVKNLKETGST